MKSKPTAPTCARYTLPDETFDHMRSIYLDKGTALFETPVTIVGDRTLGAGRGKCATLSAQGKRVAFYLDVLGRNVLMQLIKRRAGSSSTYRHERWQAHRVECAELLHHNQEES